MIFGNKKIDKDMNIRVGINGISIDRVYNTACLGVSIDDKLNWKEHIKIIQSKLSKTTAIIYKASHVLTERALYILYCSLALPYNYVILRRHLGKHIHNQCVTCFHKAKKAVKNFL